MTIRRHRRKGVVLLWVVLLMMVLIGMVGLTCDYVRVRLIIQQLQHAADAGALGGAMRVRVDTLDLAREWAFQAAGYNHANIDPITPDPNASNAAEGDIVIGWYHRASRTFVPTLVGVDAILVRTHRPDLGAPAVGLLFGPLFGASTASLGRRAIAMNILGTGAAILALNDDPNRKAPTFTTQGTCEVNVTNGSIWVNSPNSGAIKADSGSASISCPDFNICSPDAAFPSKFNLEGNFNQPVPYKEDPLLSIRNDTFDPVGFTFGDGGDDDVSVPLQTVPAGVNVVLQPGYYPAGIQLAADATMTLTSGVYVIGGNGVDIRGGANFIAHEVLLYVTGNKANACFDIRGGGIVQITPMTSGRYANVSLFQDPTLQRAAQINGQAGMHLEGTIYVPGAQLWLTGTADSFGNQLIADTILLSGNQPINIDYKGAFAQEGKVFLVE